jgi:6-methylsalicylate decarboxylase
MKHLGVQTAILSAPDPGPCITVDPDEQASLARRLNSYAASLRDEDPLTFGFFASLPDIRNSSAAIAELRYALEFLRADGVVLYTRYGPGNVYLGNEFLDPIWSELDAHNATVFVHPTHSADAVAEPWNPKLPTRMIDYPHEITRAALDMVAAKTLTRFPNVKVVLSHAGGNLPWLMGRLTASLQRLPKVAASLGQSQTGLTLQEAEDALGGFWYDVAASTAPHVLRTLLEVVPEDRIVYGSDYPYLPSPAQPSFLEDLEKSEMTVETRDKINFGNAQVLISRLAKQVGLPSVPEDELEDCPVQEQEL